MKIKDAIVQEHNEDNPASSQHILCFKINKKDQNLVLRNIKTNEHRLEELRVMIEEERKRLMSCYIDNTPVKRSENQIAYLQKSLTDLNDLQSQMEALLEKLYACSKKISGTFKGVEKVKKQSEKSRSKKQNNLKNKKQAIKRDDVNTLKFFNKISKCEKSSTLHKLEIKDLEKKEIIFNFIRPKLDLKYMIVNAHV